MAFSRYTSVLIALLILQSEMSSFIGDCAAIEGVSKDSIIQNKDGVGLKIQHELRVIEKLRNESSSDGENESVLINEDGNNRDLLSDLRDFPVESSASDDSAAVEFDDVVGYLPVEGEMGMHIDMDSGSAPGSASRDETCLECQSTMQKQAIVKEGGEEELDQLRLELIKQLILSKLRLTEPPKVTKPKTFLPSPLSHEVLPAVNDDDSMNVDDYYGKTTQVIIFSEKEITNCHPKTPEGCFHFELMPDVLTNVINSAQLWVYKRPSDTNVTPEPFIVMSELSSHNSLTTKIIGERKASVAGGWLDFNVKHLIRRWQLHGHVDHALIARCENCEDPDASPIASDEDHRPFIVINTSELRPRQKRSIDCHESISTCCRKSFYVSFEDIHWNDWIIQPEGFYANYCNGSCEGNTLPRFYHTTVMQRVSRIHRHNSQRRNELTPCCTPTAMSGLSLLYYNSTGHIYKKTLPNMIVEACGCS